jgi:glycosyltransferase involved in cell wall biosynthesis
MIGLRIKFFLCGVPWRQTYAWRPRGLKRHHDMRKLFEQFYAKKIWGGGSGESANPEFTKDYRLFLQNFLRQHNVRSVLDLGCGDWQFSRLMDWSGIEYTGIDAAQPVIESNQKNYAANNLRFIQGDINKMALPQADLAIIKDVLQHWSNAAILKLIPKLRNFPFVLLVNDFQSRNIDCQNGDWRRLNLNAPPFNLGAKEVFSFRGKKVMLSGGQPRVCIATLFGLQRGTGGIQTHSKWLMRYFAENSIEHVYASPYNYRLIFVYPVFALRHLLKYFSRHLSAYWFRKWHYYFLKKALARLFVRRHFNVVNAQGPLAARAALELRQKYGYDYQVALTVHMNWPSQAQEEAFEGNIRKGGRYYKGIKRMENWVFANADKVIAVSAYMKEALLREYPQLQSKLVAVIYNGIAADFAAGAGPAPPGQIGGKFRLVNIGALSVRKNPQFLLRVLSCLVKDFPGIELDLAGAGNYQAALAKSAAALGIKGNVRFSGYLPDVRPCLNRAQLYLHSSLGESCPYVLIEAMSFGLPIVAFACGGIPEMITHGYNGFLVQGQDAQVYAGYVRELLANRALYELMRANCLRQFQEKFRYEAMGRHFIEFYKKAGACAAST